MMRRKDAPFARPPIERHVYRGWPERQAEAREELKIIHDEGSFGRPVVLADHRFGTIPYICIRGRSSCETSREPIWNNTQFAHRTPLIGSRLGFKRLFGRAADRMGPLRSEYPT